MRSVPSARFDRADVTGHLPGIATLGAVDQGPCVDAADAALTEERWARAIEARPATVAGRSVTHHAIVRLVQEEPDALLRQANQTNDVGGVER